MPSPGMSPGEGGLAGSLQLEKEGWEGDACIYLCVGYGRLQTLFRLGEEVLVDGVCSWKRGCEVEGKLRRS